MPQVQNDSQPAMSSWSLAQAQNNMNVRPLRQNPYERAQRGLQNGVDNPYMQQPVQPVMQQQVQYQMQHRPVEKVPIESARVAEVRPGEARPADARPMEQKPDARQEVRPAEPRLAEVKSTPETLYAEKVERLRKMNSDGKVIQTLDELGKMGFLDYERNFKLCRDCGSNIEQIVNLLF